MLEINLKKRVKTERFLDSLLDFIVNTQGIADSISEESESVKGGFMDYYLINAKKFSREQFEDNVKYCKTMSYLAEVVFSKELKKFKTITVEKAMFATKANIIFKYEFYEKKFQEWQQQLFEIITFQHLTK